MIDLPPLFQTILAKDSRLYAAVLQSLAEFSDWLENSRTPFFPNYTDHGPRHIQSVLHACEGLISENSIPEVSPADIAVLSTAVILHDSALHLNEPTFVALIKQERRLSIDLYSWAELWEQYARDIRHLDQRQLTHLLGSPEPVEVPQLSSEEWRPHDYLLVGEFVRRYHPRIAHEFACWGLRNDQEQLLGIRGFDDDLRDLSGIIARSHGHSIREMYSYLNCHYYNLREYRQVHAVYLMSLLRIADVLRIEASRAPESIARIRHIQIPASLAEWKAHRAIRDLRYTHDDAEAVYIDVRPDDVETFLRVRKWVTGVQDELDHSWAVLGEVYGGSRQLSDLGLTLRRVRSNIDEMHDFSRTVPFVPELIRFDTAGADLLKLLIQPLYGNALSVAIRELVQNAVDAVQERKLRDNALLEYDGPDVTVRIDSNGVSIEDRGTGMDVSIIRDYFLKAGASLRTNARWVQQLVDSQSGDLRFPRTGRFGIGVLAAYLLGPQIHVQTRQYNSDTGYEFDATIEQDCIELRKAPCAVGTVIRIVMHPHAIRKLLRQWRMFGIPSPWRWYRLQSPTVHYIVNGKAKGPRVFVPGPSTDLASTKWHSIQHLQFMAIHWRHFAHKQLFLCNGFVIPRGRTRWSKEHMQVPLRMPSLSVFDPRGDVPLTLDRLTISETLPFADILMKDVAYGLIAELLTQPLPVPCTDPGYKRWYSDSAATANYLVRSDIQDGIQFDPLFTTASGVGLIDAWNLSKADITSLLGIVELRDSEIWDWYTWGRGAEGHPHLSCKIPMLPHGAAICGRIHLSRFHPSSGFHPILDEILTDEPDILQLGNATIRVRGIRILLPAILTGRDHDWEDSVVSLELSGFACLHADPAWSLWEMGECPSRRGFFYRLLESEEFSEPGWSGFIIQYYISVESPATTSPAADAWNECVGGPVIPFSKTKRTQLLDKLPARASYFRSKSGN